MSLRPEQVPQVREAVERYHVCKQTLEAISELNQFLLRLVRTEDADNVIWLDPLRFGRWFDRSRLACFVGLLWTLAWAGLIAANLRYLPGVPWAVVVMAAILSIWWLYFAKGRGAPRSTQFARRVAGRANRVSDDLWGPALGTGVLGLFTTSPVGPVRKSKDAEIQGLIA